jgi:hypothetical protein
MTPGRSTQYDMAPALLDAEALTAIARSRGAPAQSLAADIYRRNVSMLLAHIAALEHPEMRTSAEVPPPRVTAETAPLHSTVRVRPEMPSPGTPAFAARMRELRRAGAVPESP